MDKIVITTKEEKLSYWSAKLDYALFEGICEIFNRDYGSSYLDYNYSAKEIFCAIAEYEGGIYGNYALSLIYSLACIEIK